jgi:predicted nuclease with TOPRIM domain
LQGSLRSTLLYCYIWKVLASDDRTEDLKKKLAEAEGENAKLKEAIAKMEEDLQLLGYHSALMECEASDASKAKDRAEASLSKLSEKFMGFQGSQIRLAPGESCHLASRAC